MEKRRMLFIVWEVVVMLCVCWCIWLIGTLAISATSNAIDSISSTAYGGRREASQKASGMADIASHNANDVACEKANQGMGAAAEMAHQRGIHGSSNVCDFALEKPGRAMNTACDMEVDAKHKASEASDLAYRKEDDGMNTASLSTRDALGKENDEAYKYEDAKSKVYEAYKYAKDTMTEQAKDKYEAAKEKASDAAGNLGQKMRTASTEL